MNFRLVDRRSGFSLVELMIVVGIIGILASIAGPRLRHFISKARQAEARLNLGHLVTLEETYKAENGSYLLNVALNNVIVSWTISDYSSAQNCNIPNPLGFSLTDCRSARYLYGAVGSGIPFGSDFIIVALERSDVPFTPVGRLVFPDCSDLTLDVWFVGRTWSSHSNPVCL